MSFCLFLSILLPTPVGGGAAEQPRGTILPTVAKTAILNWPPVWGGDNDRAEQSVLKQLS